MSQIDSLIARETKEIGTKADNNKVCQYTRDYYGSDKGADWCVIFQWDMFRLSGLSSLFYDGKKTASCGAFVDWAESKNLIVKEPKPGDIIVFSFSVPHDHMGLCVKSTSAQVTTIDGNTSVSGSQSKGGEVLQRTRSKKYIYAIIRPQYTDVPTTETYTVQRGDNLTKIAKKYGITVNDIMAMNPSITNPNKIYVGQKIRVK